jgi:hypothetical protein
MCPNLQCVTVIWQEWKAQLQRVTYPDVDLGDWDRDIHRREIDHVLQGSISTLGEPVVTIVGKNLYIVLCDHDVMLK